MKDIFQLSGVRAGYGSEVVLNGIDFTIREGDFISLIGPNGTGKSTLLKVITGLKKPESGDILFRERPIGSYSPKTLAENFSVVHQSYDNIMPYSVRDFLRFGRFPHKGIWQYETEEDREIIESVIEMTSLSPLIDRRITGLSAGERQLVFIARALVQNRSVIILDEPVSHLDMKHTVKIMDILHTLNLSGATIITVLHDMNLASDYTGRIAGVKDGKIFFDGTPEDVIRYDIIEALFETTCVVTKNPTSGKPFVYTVPAYITGTGKK